MRADIVPGGVFPDYTLPDQTGVVRTLSELRGCDPLVLTLSRGHYCPKEHQQHLELAAFQPKIAVAYPRPLARPAGGHERDPPGLGPGQAGAARRLGRRRPVPLPRLGPALGHTVTALRSIARSDSRSWRRLLMPSFVKTFRRCHSTVRGLR